MIIYGHIIKLNKLILRFLTIREKLFRLINKLLYRNGRVMRETSLKVQKLINKSRLIVIFSSVILLLSGAAFGQTTNPTPQPTPAGTTNPQTTPPTNPTTSAAPPLTINPSVPTAVPQTAAPISRDQAVQMTLKQVSTYNQTQLNERIAAGDLTQAKASLYPRITSNPTLIFTSPSLANTNVNGTNHPASYLGANAITEYQGLVTATGEIDTSGRLRATIRRNQALLNAARSGTEAARRNLIVGLDEAYLNLGLAATKKTAAEENLRVAADFENLTKLLAEGGEVPPIDGVRAEVQTAARRDELLQAELNEQQAADALRVFIGYDFSQPVSVGDLLTSVPNLSELENLTSGAGNIVRPEIRQINAQITAAREGVKIARAMRRPQLTYIFDGGFISDSLFPKPIFNTLGVRATIGVTIPIFDFGASKSRETQAQIQAQTAEQSKIFTERMLAQQYRAAVLQANSARTRIRLIGENIQKAEKVVEVSTLRYRAGEAPITEVTDAQTQVITLRTALYQAIYDYQIALARIRQAVGK